MLSVEAVRDHLRLFLSGVEPLDDFEDWLVAASWNLHRQADLDLKRLVGAVELRLAEYSADHLDLEALKHEFQMLWRSLGLARLGRADMKYLERSASVSEDGLYRYWLSRRLSMGERTVLFVGLNPSTADATHDDPTIRKCVGFAGRWGFDWLLMGNLNAWRSTDPKGLPVDGLEAVGPRNQEALKWLTHRAEIVVAAWGQNKLNDYARTLSQIILGLPHARTLGTNKDGTPKHPLYLPYGTQLIQAADPSAPHG